MASTQYIINRKVYQRPQGLCLSENPGRIESGMLVPDGQEFSDFLVLSDHNRGEIDIAPERIGVKKRAINGRMRSQWIADKVTVSTSWNKLPSRAWPSGVQLDNGVNTAPYYDRYTVDGGAGANELVEWYKGHQGSFWVYLAYDRYPLVGEDKLYVYNEAIEVFFADFSYSVVSRSGTTGDLWNVDMKLEEA